MAGDQLPSRRRRLGLRKELLLAIAPTVTVLLVLALVEAVSHQRLLFASLASSAFLIYLDPGHSVNQARTLILAQLGAALIGMLSYLVLGPGYVSAGVAMISAIVLMILLDAVHPPAVATALSFGLKAGEVSNLILFCLALGITVVLLGLQRLTQYLLVRSQRASGPGGAGKDG
jgi:CBS-domain-containing membrane protein